MIVLFYVSGFAAVFSTICVVLSKNPIYAIFCLILSLLSVSCNLFSLQAPIAGAVEIIIYAGAIMVLFVFIIMMFDMKSIDFDIDDRKFPYLSIQVFLGILLSMSSLLMILLYSVLEIKNCFINVFAPAISITQIGITLFGPYMLVVEMASFLLLSALISVLHIIRTYRTVVSSDLDKS